MIRRNGPERRAINHRLYHNVNVRAVWWDDQCCTALYWRIAPTELEVAWSQRIIGHEVAHRTKSYARPHR